MPKETKTASFVRVSFVAKYEGKMYPVQYIDILQQRVPFTLHSASGGDVTTRRPIGQLDSLLFIEELYMSQTLRSREVRNVDGVYRTGMSDCASVELGREVMGEEAEQALSAVVGSSLTVPLEVLIALALVHSTMVDDSTVRRLSTFISSKDPAIVIQASANDWMNACKSQFFHFGYYFYHRKDSLSLEEYRRSLHPLVCNMGDGQEKRIIELIEEYYKGLSS